MRSWFDLANLTEEELRKLDLAEINLACALGLPGAEHLDIDLCLRQIDMLTERALRYRKVDARIPPRSGGFREFGSLFPRADHDYRSPARLRD